MAKIKGCDRETYVCIFYQNLLNKFANCPIYEIMKKTCSAFSGMYSYTSDLVEWICGNRRENLK